MEIALKYKGKQGKNGKFPSNYKASPIDFEKYKPRGLFSEFYGMSFIIVLQRKGQTGERKLNIKQQQRLVCVFVACSCVVIFAFFGQQSFLNISDVHGFLRLDSFATYAFFLLF